MDSEQDSDPRAVKLRTMLVKERDNLLEDLEAYLASFPRDEVQYRIDVATLYIH